MTAVVIVNPSEIKQFQDRVVNPSHFRVIGERLHKLEENLRKEGHNFSQEDREMLIQLAYSLIEPDHLVKQLWSFIY